MAQRVTALRLDEDKVDFRKRSLSPQKKVQKTTRQEIRSKTSAAISKDTSVKKICSSYSPRGKRGQTYLASGISLAMRLWANEQPGRAKAKTQREYETVGYVLAGRAELHIAKQKVLLEPGDSWVVPKGVLHQYRILESFTAIEATCPPAQVHGRDE